MLDAAVVASLARSFSDSTDGAGIKSRDLVVMLLECTATPFSRHQFTPGHITATGLVLAPEGERLLLVHHRRLDRWLLPGGHVEPEDALIEDTARREVIEETGVTLRTDSPPRLSGVDVHGIPPKGREPYHLHHDLVFSFRALASDLQVSPESRALVWCHPSDFDHYAVPANVRSAYERALITE